MTVFEKNLTVLCFVNTALLLVSAATDSYVATMAWFVTYPPAFVGAIWLIATAGRRRRAR